MSQCLLCGGASVVGGIFIPNEAFAKRIGQPKGKQRLVFYALCEACFALPHPDRSDRIEAKLLREMTVQ